MNSAVALFGSLAWLGLTTSPWVLVAGASPKVGRFFRISNRLPVEPSPEWFKANLVAIVQRLRRETSARIALCSLPPIGEQVPSAYPFQNDLHRLIEEFNQTILEIAAQEQTCYIQLYEEISEQIRASPGQAFICFKFLPFYRDADASSHYEKEPR